MPSTTWMGQPVRSPGCGSQFISEEACYPVGAGGSCKQPEWGSRETNALSAQKGQQRRGSAWQVEQRTGGWAGLLSGKELVSHAFQCCSTSFSAKTCILTQYEQIAIGFLSSPKSHWFILMVPACCTLNPNSVVQKLALPSFSPSFLFSLTLPRLSLSSLLSSFSLSSVVPSLHSLQIYKSWLHYQPSRAHPTSEPEDRDAMKPSDWTSVYLSWK